MSLGPDPRMGAGRNVISGHFFAFFLAVFFFAVFFFAAFFFAIEFRPFDC